MMSKVIGGFERVDFPDFGVNDVVAKIDTGASSGALHCSTPHIEADQTGAKVLVFSPFDHPDVEIRTLEYSRRKVRSSNGMQQFRYGVDTIVKIKGKKYPIHITLSDRKSMMVPVLIGRKFLKDHGFLVDVARESK